MENNLYQKDNAAMSGKSLCSIAWTIFTHFPTFSCAETIKLDLDCQTALAWAVCLPWAPQGPAQRKKWLEAKPGHSSGCSVALAMHSKTKATDRQESKEKQDKLTSSSLSKLLPALHGSFENHPPHSTRGKKRKGERECKKE